MKSGIASIDTVRNRFNLRRGKTTSDEQTLAPKAYTKQFSPPQLVRAHHRRRPISPLTGRILAVNSVALVLLALGLLYLDRYQQTLINVNISELTVQAKLIAGAVAEEAAIDDFIDTPWLSIDNARGVVRRLSVPTLARAQLFGPSGELLFDSALVLRGGMISVLPLPDTSGTETLTGLAGRIYDEIFNALPRRDRFSPYKIKLSSDATGTDEGRRALAGEVANAVYLDSDGRLVFNVALPVQHYRQVLGVLMLSRNSADMDEALRQIRFNILLVFIGAFAITGLLSIYLAGTIARPIRRLALAADRLRVGRSRVPLPDFSQRNDEIGDLSAALHEMTQALWQRMEAIEAFAADVAHEIKNPLTSVRSAVETVLRVEDPIQRQRLLELILDDVGRLDRLISDISRASRLDVELARAEFAPIKLGELLQALVEVENASVDPFNEKKSTFGDDRTHPIFSIESDPAIDLTVLGISDRIVQVFRNLIANAVSFSPPNGTIRIVAIRIAQHIRVAIEDDGPGIPPSKTEAIFDRFYSERPAAEKFGTHSGLGLSISKQIIEAHEGRIWAENRLDDQGVCLGARFIVQLPTAPTMPAKRGT